jgi:hypothetical protein
MLAQRSGLRIHEVPVDWADNSDGVVDVLSTPGIARAGGDQQRGRSRQI